MFIDCSELIEKNTPRLMNGAAIVDLNNDGHFEIFICGFGCDNQALGWKNGKLIEIHIPEILRDSEGEAISVCAADIDCDGREELYILNNDTKEGLKPVGDRIFAYFGDRWMDLLASAENAHVMNFGSGRSVACIDRKGNGKYGFIIVNRGNPWRLYEINYKGKLFDMAEEAGLDIIAEGMSVISAQIVSERMDIFATTRHGNFLFRNLGSGTFEEISEEVKIDDPGQINSGATVIDSDGDGLFDLIYGSRDGENRLYLQRPGGGFLSAASEALARPAHVQNIIVADFDNDGFEEIFFHVAKGRNRLFKYIDDEWTDIPCLEAEDEIGEARGAVVGDFDHDGQLELLLTRGFKTEQSLRFFKTLATKNNWLRLCILTPSGAPARGARVRLFADGRSQLRSICAGSGYLCQMEPVAHFGLGKAQIIDHIEIRWPDGSFEVLRNIKPNQNLTILHPDGRRETLAEKC
ncbi:MAG: CRTAC1 family protein [Alphaproteobacteria bacterium]|jgi:hypothetical protein|nr:CRTAC1 family protein [Alphaproteobacteria bacterium]MBP9877273.1 CRTAC1 family protein [Alphaproteobacteria bacterium]